MKVVVAPDKFKDSLTAAEEADHLIEGLAHSIPDTWALPLADGGDGSVAAALAGGFQPLTVDVHGARSSLTSTPWRTSPKRHRPRPVAHRRTVAAHGK